MSVRGVVASVDLRAALKFAEEVETNVVAFWRRGEDLRDSYDGIVDRNSGLDHGVDHGEQGWLLQSMCLNT